MMQYDYECNSVTDLCHSVTVGSASQLDQYVCYKYNLKVKRHWTWVATDTDCDTID